MKDSKKAKSDEPTPFDELRKLGDALQRGDDRAARVAYGKLGSALWGEPTPFDELRRLLYRFVPRPREGPKNESSESGSLRREGAGAEPSAYSDDERRNQKIARILHELGSASLELLDALVNDCNKQHEKEHEKQHKDIEVRDALVALLDDWDSCDRASAKNLDLTQRAMNLAADGLIVLSDDPAWSPDAVLAPTQVEKMRECLHRSSNLAPAERTKEEPQAMGVTLAKQLVRAMIAEEVRAAAPKLADGMFDYRRKQRQKPHAE